MQAGAYGQAAKPLSATGRAGARTHHLTLTPNERLRGSSNAAEDRVVPLQDVRGDERECWRVDVVVEAGRGAACIRGVDDLVVLGGPLVVRVSVVEERAAEGTAVVGLVDAQFVVGGGVVPETARDVVEGVGPGERGLVSLLWVEGCVVGWRLSGESRIACWCW